MGFFAQSVFSCEIVLNLYKAAYVNTFAGACVDTSSAAAGFYFAHVVTRDKVKFMRKLLVNK